MTTQEQSRTEEIVTVSTPPKDYVIKFVTYFDILMLRHASKLDQDITRLPQSAQNEWATTKSDFIESEQGEVTEEKREVSEVGHIILAGYLAGLYAKTNTILPDPLK